MVVILQNQSSLRIICPENTMGNLLNILFKRLSCMYILEEFEHGIWAKILSSLKEHISLPNMISKKYKFSFQR